MKSRSQQFEVRQNMARPNFEVFHYATPTIEEVDLHHHDFYEVFLLLDGTLEYRVEGRTYHLEPGDLLLMSPMEFHKPLISRGIPYERIVLWINSTYLESLSDGGVQLGLCFDRGRPTHANLIHLTGAQRSAMTSRLEDLIREAYSNDYGSTFSAGGALVQFLVELNRIALHREVHSGAAGEESALVSQVLAYIGEHYCDPLSLDQLSHRFFVSKYHLSHEFQRAVGTSIYRYIILRRLLMARQMMAAGQMPGSVCHQCGFNDYANFYRAFKAEYGIGPKEYAAGL